MQWTGELICIVVIFSIKESYPWLPRESTSTRTLVRICHRQAVSAIGPATTYRSKNDFDLREDNKNTTWLWCLEQELWRAWARTLLFASSYIVGCGEMSVQFWYHVNCTQIKFCAYLLPSCSWISACHNGTIGALIKASFWDNVNLFLINEEVFIQELHSLLPGMDTYT